MGILRFWIGNDSGMLSISSLKSSIFVKIFRIFRGRESRIFIYEKNILLQRTYEWVEYATICAYFYTSPTSRLHICINMQLGLQIWGFEVKKKSQDFVEKSQDFVKTSRRLVKNIQGFFSTKPWIVQTKSDVVPQNHFFRATAFVKIFRIFSFDTARRFGRLQRYQQGIVDRVREHIHPNRIYFGRGIRLCNL